MTVCEDGDQPVVELSEGYASDDEDDDAHIYGTKHTIGLCAMDKKVRSTPMQRILEHLLKDGLFQPVYFGDDLIKNRDIAKWPECEFVIAFHSSGFPLEKAIDYVRKTQPFSVNDLPMQQVLRDRRLVLLILDACGIPTPRRLIVNRKGGPNIRDPELRARLKRKFGIDLDAPEFKRDSVIKRVDAETIEVDGKRMSMPFVEKPADGEDHRVRIYYDSTRGGGVRQLFRKVENRSSEFLHGYVELRTDTSYVYEEFLDVDNAEDVKLYTVGSSFAHAETRKSPVVDGEVVRNAKGKEIRQPTELSKAERDMARIICRAFGQTICGFDLLRCHGKSYVMDVNGWSFVKGNDEYYRRCAKILRAMFIAALHRRRYSLSLPDKDCALGNL